MLLQVGGILLLQHARGGRCREHDRHLVLLDQAPPDAGIGAQRRAFVHQCRHAGNQRAVDDVGVTDDPADVRGREHRFAGVAAVDVLHRRGQRDRVAAGVALHALRLAGGARGVQDVGGLARLQPDAGHAGIHVLRAQRRVIDIAAGGAREVLLQPAIDHEHLFRRVLGQRAGLVQQMLVGHDLAAAHAGLGRYDHLGSGVIDARGQRTGGETAEHHRVDGADARTRQHRESGLGNHRHVDQHAVAAAHAERLQDGRRALDLALQFGEGVGLLGVGLGRHENQRRRVRTLRGMTVDRVVTQIGGTADEPLGKRRTGKIADLLRRRLPVDQTGLLGPELIAFGDRAGTELLAC